MEDIKLKQIFTDVCPHKIKKITCHPEKPWFLASDSKSNVTLWEYEGSQKLLSTFTTNSLIKDSSGIKLPPLGVSLKSVWFFDEYTLKWNSVSRMGFTMSNDYQTNDQIGKDSPYSFIIFVFELFIVFHDYKTKINKYLQKTDIDSKGFASWIGVSQDFVAIGSTDGWITMFKISEWSVGRLLCCSYNIPPTPGKGYINLKILSSFFPKIYPITPCNYFCENRFQKIVQLLNIWMGLM